MNAFIKKLRDRVKEHAFELLFVGIFLLLSTGIFLWFKNPDSIVLAGDFGWPLDFKQFFRTTFSSWDNKVDFGYLATRQNSSFFPYATYGVLLQNFSLSPHQIQLVIFYLSFLASCFGTYLFLSEFTKNKFGSFIGGLFYALNPYALSIAWNPSYGLTFPFYTWLPFALFFVLKLLKSNNFRDVILYAVIIECLPVGFSFGNPAFFIMLLGIILVIFLIVYVKSNFATKIRSHFFFFLFLYFIFNVFWIGPFVSNLHYEYASATNAAGGLMDDSNTLRLNSISFSNAFRTSGIWALKAGNFGDDYYDWKSELDKPIAIISEIAPIFLILAFLVGRGKKRPSLLLIVFLLLYILFFFLNSAYYKGGIYESIVSNFFISDFIVRSYRSVFLKLGVVLALSVSVLLAETVSVKSIDGVFNIKKGVLILLAAILITATLGAPYMKGQVIKSASKTLPPYAITIPSEYWEFSTFAKQHLKEGRILSLPLPRSYNIFLHWGKGNGFNGADFLRYLVNQPLIYVNFDNGTMNKFIQTVLTSQNPDIYFRILNIRYIFQRKDTPKIAADGYLLYDLPNITNYFQKIYSSKYFDFYEIKKEKYTPLIYIPQNFKYVKSIEVSSIQSSDSKLAILTDSDQVHKTMEGFASSSTASQVYYSQFSPTLYKVDLNFDSDNVPLVFSEAYEAGWKIVINGRIISKGKHLLVNGFGNFWLLDKRELCLRSVDCVKRKDGSYSVKFTIEYIPQKIFLSCFILSFSIFLLSICAYLMTFPINYIKSHLK